MTDAWLTLKGEGPDKNLPGFPGIPSVLSQPFKEILEKLPLEFISNNIEDQMIFIIFCNQSGEFLIKKCFIGTLVVNDTGLK